MIKKFEITRIIIKSVLKSIEGLTISLMVTKRTTKMFFIIFLLLLFTIEVYCSEKDSIMIYIENDSVDYKINVVFKNITNDSIWLYGNFKEFYYDFPSSSGYIVLYYFNNKLVVPKSMNYDCFNDRKLKVIPIPPKEMFKMPLRISWFGTSEQAKKNEYGVELHLFYNYMTKRKFMSGNVRTNYLKLEYE